MDDGTFVNLYEIREHAQKTHALIQQYSLGEKNLNVWREHVNMFTHMINNMPLKSHAQALVELKSYFGDDKGMPKSVKKAADDIIKETQKPNYAAPGFESMQGPGLMAWGPAMHMNHPPMGMVGFNQGGFPQPPFMAPSIQQPNFSGTCFLCYQPGHMAKNCPSQAGRYGPARSQGNSNGGRRGGSSGGFGGNKPWGKKNKKG